MRGNIAKDDSDDHLRQKPETGQQTVLCPICGGRGFVSRRIGRSWWNFTPGIWKVDQPEPVECRLCKDEGWVSEQKLRAYKRQRAGMAIGCLVLAAGAGVAIVLALLF